MHPRAFRVCRSSAFTTVSIKPIFPALVPVIKPQINSVVLNGVHISLVYHPSASGRETFVRVYANVYEPFASPVRFCSSFVSNTPRCSHSDRAALIAVSTVALQIIHQYEQHNCVASFDKIAFLHE